MSTQPSLTDQSMPKIENYLIWHEAHYPAGVDFPAAAFRSVDWISVHCDGSIAFSVFLVLLC